MCWTQARVWDVTSGECLAVLKGHERRVNAVVFSPIGANLATCSDDKTVRLWDIEKHSCVQTYYDHSGCVP